MCCLFIKWGVGMKVITLKQPWATLIALGYKKYEFRSWNFKYRGEILIHAGLGVDKEAMERVKYLNLDYPKSKIVAKVTITDCLKLNEDINRKIIKENPIIYKSNIMKEGYVWILDNVEKINGDKNISGKQGIWNVSEYD